MADRQINIESAPTPALMQLSDGSATSKTAPLPPSSVNTSPAQRVTDRFSVRGNAIVTGGAGDIGSIACRALLEHGVKGLAIFDIHPDKADSTLETLQHEFPKLGYYFGKST